MFEAIIFFEKFRRKIKSEIVLKDRVLEVSLSGTAEIIYGCRF